MSNVALYRWQNKDLAGRTISFADMPEMQIDPDGCAPLDLTPLAEERFRGLAARAEARGDGKGWRQVPSSNEALWQSKINAAKAKLVQARLGTKAANKAAIQAAAFEEQCQQEVDRVLADLKTFQDAMEAAKAPAEPVAPESGAAA